MPGKNTNAAVGIVEVPMEADPYSTLRAGEDAGAFWVGAALTCKFDNCRTHMPDWQHAN